MEIRESARIYAREVGRWGWFVFLGIGLGILGSLSDAWQFRAFLIPLALIALAIGPFVAFHKQRLRFRDMLASQSAELLKEISETNGKLDRLKAFTASKLSDKEDENHRLREEIIDLRGQLGDRSPCLVAGVLETAICRRSMQSPVIGLFILIDIRNTGHSSIAHGFGVHVELSDGRRFEGNCERIDLVHLPVGATEQVKIITSEQQIQDIARNPIERGGQAVGYLLATFTDFSAEELVKLGSRYVIRFFDMLGNQITCDELLTEDKLKGNARWYEGDPAKFVRQSQIRPSSPPILK